MKHALSATAAAIAAAVTLAGCSAPAASNGGGDGTADTPAKVTDVSLYYSAPIAEQSLAQIALDNGLFPENVNVDVQGGDSTVGVTLVSSGRVQFYINSSPVVEQVASGGAPLQWIAGWQKGVTTQLIAREGFDKVADLEGATLGIIQPGLTLSVLANTALREADVDPANTTQLALGNVPAINSAFAAGTVDAIVTNIASANALLPQVAGSKVLKDFSENFTWNGAGVAVNTDFAADNREAVVAVLQGLDAALRLFHDDPEAVAPSIEKVTGQPAEAVAATIALLQEKFEPELYAIDLDSETAVIDIMAAEGNAWATEDFAKKVLGDPSYLEEAQEK